MERAGMAVGGKAVGGQVKVGPTGVVVLDAGSMAGTDVAVDDRLGLTVGTAKLSGDGVSTTAATDGSRGVGVAFGAQAVKVRKMLM